MLQYPQLIRVVGLYKDKFYAANGYCKGGFFYPEPYNERVFMPLVKCEAHNKCKTKLVYENIRAVQND